MAIADLINDLQYRITTWHSHCHVISLITHQQPAVEFVELARVQHDDADTTVLL